MTRRLKLAQLQISDLSADPIDRMIREAERVTSNGPSYHRSVTRVGWFAWYWQITDEAIRRPDLTIVASGMTRTQGGGWNRLERAYDRLLEQAERRRAEEQRQAEAERGGEGGSW
jgi:hypothetical protein